MNRFLRGFLGTSSQIIANPVSGTVPLAVSFSIPLSLYPPSAAGVNWIFGDGATLSNDVPSPVTHTYTKAGTYTVNVQLLSETGSVIATLSGDVEALGETTITVLPSDQKKQASLFSSPWVMILTAGAAVSLLASMGKKKRKRGKRT